MSLENPVNIKSRRILFFVVIINYSFLNILEVIRLKTDTSWVMMLASPLIHPLIGTGRFRCDVSRVTFVVKDPSFPGSPAM